MHLKSIDAFETVLEDYNRLILRCVTVCVFLVEGRAQSCQFAQLPVVQSVENIEKGESEFSSVRMKWTEMENLRQIFFNPDLSRIMQQSVDRIGKITTPVSIVVFLQVGESHVDSSILTGEIAPECLLIQSVIRQKYNPIPGKA